MIGISLEPPTFTSPHHHPTQHNTQQWPASYTVEALGRGSLANPVQLCCTVPPHLRRQCRKAFYQVNPTKRFMTLMSGPVDQRRPAARIMVDQPLGEKHKIFILHRALLQDGHPTSSTMGTYKSNCPRTIHGQPSRSRLPAAGSRRCKESFLA